MPYSVHWTASVVCKSVFSRKHSSTLERSGEVYTHTQRGKTALLVLGGCLGRAASQSKTEEETPEPNLLPFLPYSRDGKAWATIKWGPFFWVGGGRIRCAPRDQTLIGCWEWSVNESQWFLRWSSMPGVVHAKLMHTNRHSLSLSGIQPHTTRHTEAQLKAHCCWWALVTYCSQEAVRLQGLKHVQRKLYCLHLHSRPNSMK